MVDKLPECLSLKNSFAKETAIIIISDDLCMIPNIFATIVHLFQKHEIIDISKKKAFSLSLSIYIYNSHLV